VNILHEGCSITRVRNIFSERAVCYTFRTTTLFNDLLNCQSRYFFFEVGISVDNFIAWLAVAFARAKFCIRTFQ
jgi:hypothetical protein